MSQIDAGVSSITTPSGTTCNTNFSPVVTLKNCGINPLTSCTINYNVDNGTNQTYSWTGSLNSLATMVVTLPAMAVTAGTHTFTSSSSNPNSSTDGNASNDQSSDVFNVTTTIATLPLQEGFEGGATIPAGWTIYNPNNDGTWVVSTTAGNNSTNSIMVDNCNPSVNTSGEIDRLILPVYDFSAATSANMAFDVAYAKLILSNKTYGDSLAVLSSVDCGSTWSVMYLKGGATLATAPDVTVAAPTCFTPTVSTQWRTENIDLSALTGKSNIMFAFENRSQWGEGIYVDNINITSVTGIESLHSRSGFSIYPNPANSLVTIEGATRSDKVHYSLCNMLGAEIRSGDISSSGNNFSGKIQVSDISAGMYLLKITDADGSYTKKLNKQ